MSLSRMLWSMALAAAGMAGVAQADHRPSYVTPYSSAPVISTPAGPGCLTPTPGTVITPGTITPGTITPGTITPGTPGTPGMPSSPTSPTSPTDIGSAAGAAAAGTGLGGGGGEGGSGGLTSSAPNMIGDLGIKSIFFDRSLVTTTSPSPGASYNNGSRSGRSAQSSPLVNNGTFRIVENESPRPQNRVFFGYNFFDQVGGNLVTNSYDLHRMTVGFEYAFLDQNASFGLRLPILVRDGGIGQSVDGFSDLTVIGKYAFINDRETGNVVGAGLAVTIPIGREFRTGATNREINNVLLQPFVGFLANADAFYVQGFSSYVLPTNSIDTHIIANDIGIGWRLYQSPGAGLSAVIPTIEAHLLTPLNNQGIGPVLNGTAEIGTPHQLVMTVGVHLGLGDRTWLTLAAGAPITGPKLYNWEGTILLNFAY